MTADSDPNRSLTAIPGIRVGHAADPVARTGCTAVLGPFTAAAYVHGLATGSRELDALSPLHVVPRCDALLLTGGSAFGLAAADGVVRWLEERGEGFPTGAAVVPIVPAAVIYDLRVGRPDVRPGPAMGYEAARAASDAPVPEGSVGVGTGATVGKVGGSETLQPAGVGSWADPEPPRVAALVVVNAFGDVVDGKGAILAGARDRDGGFVDTAASIRGGRRPPAFGSEEGGAGPSGEAAGALENTTLAVVATEAGLSKTELQIVARQAAAALSRRISPSGTLFDGDLVFALSTTERRETLDPVELTALGLRAQAALETAIERASGPAAAGPTPSPPTSG